MNIDNDPSLDKNNNLNPAGRSIGGTSGTTVVFTFLNYI